MTANSNDAMKDGIHDEKVISGYFGTKREE